MSRVLPILFNTEMVRANLDGRKTCTRRLVRFLPGENPQWTGYIRDGLMLYNGRNEPCIMKAPYQPGDILYVRETWCALPVNEAGHIRGHSVYYYKADGDLRPEGWRGKWHPSIRMPKEAARIWLKVTDVRVERLQEMWASDASKEGIYFSKPTTADEMLIAFAKLWDSTIKKSDIYHYGWDANPYVWVIEYERGERPEGA